MNGRELLTGDLGQGSQCDEVDQHNPVTPQVVFLPEELIRKNTYQPRHHFDENLLDELARSIKEKGVIQPIIVRSSEEGYELIAGERRLQAARRAGLKKIPALLREVRDRQDLLEIALIENIQREDLNPIDRGRSYRRLIDEFGETQEQIAERVGKDRSTIANTLRILELPREIRDMIEAGRLNFGQARSLLSIDSRDGQLRLARRAADGGLSVRELEKIALRGKSSPALPTGKMIADPDLQYALDILREHLKAKVTIRRRRRGGGKIEIEFYSEQELTRLCRLLGVEDHRGDERNGDEVGDRGGEGIYL